MSQSTKSIYLDNNATTALDPLVLEEMTPYFHTYYGNPNSNHSFGKTVLPALQNSAHQIYSTLNISTHDTLITTSCATESINTVHKNTLLNFIQHKNPTKNQLVTSSTEHPAVKNSLEYLSTFGIDIITIDSKNDTIDLEQFYTKINPQQTLLVSICLVNEIGVIHPIKEIATYCQEHHILCHTDATQAIGKIPIDLQSLAVDYLSFSAHKFHGPKGVGGLFIRHNAPMIPLLHGGNQMGGFRSGTLNVPGIIGMGKALEIFTHNEHHYTQHIQQLKDCFEEFLSNIPNCTIYGIDQPRIPNTTFFNIKHIDPDFLMWHLDQHNIYVSTGSACQTKKLKDSINKDTSNRGIRVSFSRYNTLQETTQLIKTIQNIL